MPGLSCELMASSMPDAAVGGPTHLALRVHKLGGKGSASSCCLKPGPWVRLSSISCMEGQLED